MAFTQSDIDTLDRAISGGELTVKIGERLVTYRSFQELALAREFITGELARAASQTPRSYPRHQLADFSDPS